MAKSMSFRHSLTEATLIVASVLLAFWIDAWWDGRRAAIVEGFPTSKPRGTTAWNTKSRVTRFHFWASPR